MSNIVQKSTAGLFTAHLTASTTLNGVTAGNSIIVFVSHSNASANGAGTTVAEGATNYTLAVRTTGFGGAANTTSLEQYVLTAVAAGTHTITATAIAGTAANSFGKIEAFEVPPLATVAVDQTVSGNGNNNAPACGPTGTLANASEIAFAAFDGNTTGITNPPTGESWFSEYADTSEVTLYIASLLPGATTALSAAWGNPSAGGWLTSIGTYKLAGAALAGGATAVIAALAGLSTAIQAAGSASAVMSAVGGFTNWATVTLAPPLYTGPGGILDPALSNWVDGAPGVGNTLLYDGTHITIYPNGEISSDTNNCSAVVQYSPDGVSWAVDTVILTPQMVSYAGVVAAAAATLTTGIQTAGAAFASITAAGNLSTAIELAANAVAISQAASSLVTSILLNTQALATVSASGALTGGVASLQGNANVLSSVMAGLTTHVQLAAQVLVNSSVVGALAAQITMTGAATTLTQANAQLSTAILLAGNPNIVSSAAGAALLTTAFAGAANAVSSALGSLLTALMLAGTALVQTQAQGDLSTGITLAGGAIADTAASLKPVGMEGQFGAATINVLSPTGLPVAQTTILAGSSCIVSISYVNALGVPFVPNGVSYQVSEVVSGKVVVPWTPISTPATSNAITITSAQNLMVNLTRSSEVHEIVFEITDGVGNESLASELYSLVRLAGMN